MEAAPIVGAASVDMVDLGVAAGEAMEALGNTAALGVMAAPGKMMAALQEVMEAHGAVPATSHPMETPANLRDLDTPGAAAMDTGAPGALLALVDMAAPGALLMLVKPEKE